MSASLSVNPVGMAAALQVARPHSQTVDQSVATQLPANQSVTASEHGGAMRHDTAYSDAASGRFSNQTIINRDAGMIVYQLVDNRSGLVVRQFPDEAMQRRRAYFRTLDAMKDDTARVAMDRKA
ncbi:MAG TPA: hypothetical protein VNZ94_04520 [Xanthobacteraceae bacterium]|nr:hypothetical protein [Xanthobacteraceae bacterium]